MSNRAINIKRLQDALPESVRINAANKYKSATELAAEITGETIIVSPYMSFLAGWDAAMELRLPALSDENDKLHSQLFDLIHEKVKDGEDVKSKMAENGT